MHNVYGRDSALYCPHYGPRQVHRRETVGPEPLPLCDFLLFIVILGKMGNWNDTNDYELCVNESTDSDKKRKFILLNKSCM